MLASWLSSLNIRPRDLSLYQQALIHKSATPVGQGVYNERLEFLGDRVLGLIIAQWLCDIFPADQEGDLAQRHGVLVSKSVLLSIAQKLGLPAHIKMSQALHKAPESRVESIYADGLEAFLAALYLDQDLEVVSVFVRDHWADAMVAVSVSPKDAKSSLQEWSQSQGMPLPEYRMLEKEGPDHSPTFMIEVTVHGLGSAIVKASSKKLGEQQAAQELLERIVS